MFSAIQQPPAIKQPEPRPTQNNFEPLKVAQVRIPIKLIDGGKIFIEPSRQNSEISQFLDGQSFLRPVEASKIDKVNFILDIPAVAKTSGAILGVKIVIPNNEGKLQTLAGLKAYVHQDENGNYFLYHSIGMQKVFLNGTTLNIEAVIIINGVQVLSSSVKGIGLVLENTSGISLQELKPTDKVTVELRLTQDAKVKRTGSAKTSPEQAYSNLRNLSQ